MTDKRTFRCDYCDDPCILIMYGMGAPDDEHIRLVCCPYDGTGLKDTRSGWKEVKE